MRRGARPGPNDPCAARCIWNTRGQSAGNGREHLQLRPRLVRYSARQQPIVQLLSTPRDRVVFELYTPGPEQPADGSVTATTTNALCTSGFNWKLWSGGEVFGCTADHRNAASGDTVHWYNDKRTLGVWDSGETGAPHSAAADTLLRGFPSNSGRTVAVHDGSQRRLPRRRHCVGSASRRDQLRTVRGGVCLSTGHVHQQQLLS